MLKSISAWGMSSNMSNNVNQINNRESIKISKEMIESKIVKDQFETYMNFIHYFKMIGFQLRFFMQNRSLDKQKPIFISLLNKEGYEIFLNAVMKNEVTLTALNPNPSNYERNKKLFEHINIITEKEITEYVEKLSYLQS